MTERTITTVGGTPIGSHEAIKPNGQQIDYVILTAEERAKGFVEPVRRSYRHVGTRGPKHALRDLTEDEHHRYADVGYVKLEAYPEGSRSLGRFWTQEQLDKVGKGCGTVTTMSGPIAETYARSPEFYGGTFCCGCGVHLPVGDDGEFVWDGTDQRVGTRRPSPTSGKGQENEHG
jgi:hypothetical protein